MVSYPMIQVPMIVLEEKKATLRKPTYKITVGKWRKFTSDRRYKAFARAFIESAEIISVDDIDDSLAKELGYNSRAEYLANGWNDEYDERLLIRWSKIEIYWDVVEAMGVFDGF